MAPSSKRAQGTHLRLHTEDICVQEEIKACIELCNEENIDISRLALRYALDEIDGDIVLCGTARPIELDENIKNATTPLTPSEKVVAIYSLFYKTYYFSLCQKKSSHDCPNSQVTGKESSLKPFVIG
jgi:aryl-alcohol dehydrogenase-like predicted oxidoreductase